MKLKRTRLSLSGLVLLATAPIFSLAFAPPQRSQPSSNPRIQQLEIVLELVKGESRTIIGGFKSVSGLTSETEVVEFREGGDPEVVRKLPGRTKYSNIVLKRGIVDRDQNELWLWRKAIIDGISDRRDGAVVLLDRAGREVVRYPFFNAFPVAWRGFNLDGDGDTEPSEILELAVEKLLRSQ